MIAMYYLGIDLGGTNTKLGILDDDGNILGKGSVPTRIQEGPKAACQRIAEGVTKLLADTGIAREQIASAGLASAGTMDIPGRRLMIPANLGPLWNYCPICDMMSDACGGIPVIFANDASAAAFAEFWVGKGKTATQTILAGEGFEKTDRPINSMILLTLGTGIGCGIVLDRMVYDGAHSHAGEYGHSIIDYAPNARVCGCGRPGHFEAYASATALIARAKEAVAAGAQSSLVDRLADLDTVGAKVVAEEAEKGDAVAMNLIIETAKYLAVGIATLMHTIDPDAIFIGGAMIFGGNKAELGRKFLQAIKDEVAVRAYRACAMTTTLDFADLGGDAGFIGAAGIAKFTK